MLSTVSVTSARIFSDTESKLTSLIVMTIFKSGLQFRMGEEETFRKMISAERIVSRDHKLPGREMVRGTFLDKCFKNHINNQREELLNGADIYGIYFQCDGATIKDTHLLNILAGGFTYLCQSKRLWTIQFTSQVVTRRILNVLRKVSLMK